MERLRGRGRGDGIKGIYVLFDIASYGGLSLYDLLYTCSQVLSASLETLSRDN